MFQHRLLSVYMSAVFDSNFRSELINEPRSALSNHYSGLDPGHVDALASAAERLRDEGMPGMRDASGPTASNGRLVPERPVSLSLLERDLASWPEPRIALIVMPFASVWYASIGVSLLQAALRQIDVDARIVYLNTDFAERIGVRDYDGVGLESPPTALAGEWVFQDQAVTAGSAGSAFVQDVLMKRHLGSFDFIDLIRIGRVRDATSAFVADVANDPIWSAVDLVGFTTTFHQNVSAIRLAERLHDRFPDLPIVFGGANIESTMGVEMAKQFPWISAIFQGESEESFTRYIERLAGGHVDPVGGETQIIVGESVANLDSLPVPSYRDFFARREESTLPDGFAIPFETSRGCWWGERRHCTFCGLNAETMAYRSKTPTRAFDELVTLTQQGGNPSPAHIMVVDNILDYHYFDTLLPEIAASEIDFRLHFEVKANLKLSEVEVLSRAGVSHIQPGIESLSDNVLRLMRKGTTRLQNIQTLKWCAEHGIHVSWNYLYGFPGETIDDYVDAPEVFRLIEHLTPPEHHGRARADRFSPFFAEPEALGIDSLEPEPAYSLVYPALSPESVDAMAYHFRIRSSRIVADIDLLDFKQAIATWQQQRSATLTARWTGSAMTVTDRRSMTTRPSPFEVATDAARVLVALDRAGTVDDVVRHTSGLNPIQALQVESILADLMDHGLVLQKGSRYLSLPVLDRDSLPTGWLRPERVRSLSVRTEQSAMAAVADPSIGQPVLLSNKPTTRSAVDSVRRTS